ncbi:hypothetical protein TNCV_4080711 [Trichonephila clavipes]|nr:hypothetical protein TNCV_4080711 [Trichonephila clavipes]
MEFYVIQPKKNKQIKVVIKGLPHCTKPQDIVTDLEELGYTITRSADSLPLAIGSSPPRPHLLNPQTKNATQDPLGPSYGVKESD